MLKIKSITLHSFGIGDNKEWGVLWQQSYGETNRWLQTSDIFPTLSKAKDHRKELRKREKALA